YDRDGQRAEACGTLDADTVAIALPARGCPRWVMPDLHGTSLVNPSYDAVALARAAWSQLDPGERHVVFERLGDEPEVLERLGDMIADPAGRIDAARALTLAYRAVPSDLRSKSDAWIVDKLGPFARSFTDPKLDLTLTALV